MQNPFITTFSKNPDISYVYTEKTDEILNNFSYEKPSESVYKITGVRGSGKTVILAKIEEMLKLVQKKNKKIFIGIDEVTKTKEMVQFASEFGKWLRADYPVYLVCTGLYENIMEVSNVKNLTFFRRAVTVQTEKLNEVRMAGMYSRLLSIEMEEARKMAKITKGYAYAFQELGSLYFNKKKEETLDDLIPALKAELFAYSYEKIWEELTEGDRSMVKLLTLKTEYKRDEVLKLMGERKGNYSMYRDRLLKRGLLESWQAYISFSLPFFADYINEYC